MTTEIEWIGGDVDPRCPDLIALMEDSELIEGQVGYVQGDLYGIWVEWDDGKRAWFYKDMAVWFTPDIRIARAQYVMVGARFTDFKVSMEVCRLGPNGEPIQLE